jgi:hypothetical protein
MLIDTKDIFKSTSMKDTLSALRSFFDSKEPVKPTVSAMEINSVVEFFKDEKTQNVINVLNKIMTLPQEEYMSILKSMKIDNELKSVVQDLPKIVSDAKTEAKEIIKESHKDDAAVKERNHWHCALAAQENKERSRLTKELQEVFDSFPKKYLMPAEGVFDYRVSFVKEDCKKAEDFVKEDSKKAEDFAKILTDEWSLKNKCIKEDYSGYIENAEPGWVNGIKNADPIVNGIKYVDWDSKPLMKNSFRRVSNEEILNEKIATTPKQYKEEVEETEE